MLLVPDTAELSVLFNSALAILKGTLTADRLRA